MSAASTYYSFIQRPTRVAGGGASPQTAGHEAGHSIGAARRRQTAASPSCSSIASSSNSSSSLNGFTAIGASGCNSSMASPVPLASPCSSSISSSASTTSSHSSSSSSSGGISSSRQRDMLRQTSLTPTQGADMSRQLFHSCTLHSLDPKPLKPFKSSSEYLEAMKEDLAEWLNRLYSDLDLNPDNFFQQLETGAVICRHANNVTQMGRGSMLEQVGSQHAHCGSTSDMRPEDGGSTRSSVNSGRSSQQVTDNQSQQQETFTTHENEPNNNNIISSRSPSISLSSPNDSLQYQPYWGSVKSSLSLSSGSGNGGVGGGPGNSLMMINSHSPRQQDYGNGHSYNSHKTINWFQVKMIPFKQDAMAGTFHARDNICQFILWCRSLNIMECLLFETDDLVARKNEKSFILCLLEVARIGFKVGMPTPLIIQLEQEIDREIENDAKRQKQLDEEEEEKLNQASDVTTISDSSGLDTDERKNCDSDQLNGLDNRVYKHSNDYATASKAIVLDDAKIEEKQVEDERRNREDEVEEEELDFGPKPQVITNDLLSLHEKVVQLLCQCTCPTQFPMVRVGDNGKYKVGDKLIIFVRILRRHIMVRVGGGWQELSEFLRVKDPCRAKSPPHQTHGHQHYHSHSQNQHQSQLAKLVPGSRSRFGESIHHLNKGHQHHHHQSYRNNGGQRLISGSASMSWLSHNS